MSVITLPTAIGILQQGWGQHRNDIEYRSPFGAQAVEGSGPLWVAAIVAPPRNKDVVGAWQSLMLRLRGRTNQLAMHCLSRPAPLGTMRGTMTLNAEALQGAVALSIVASGENAKTLVEGDLLGLGSGVTQQVVMLTADATSNGSGVIAVSIEPPLRYTHAAAAAVTWDKPQVLFRRKVSASNWDYKGSTISGMSLDMIEDVRA
jgi:hypothetical protein